MKIPKILISLVSIFSLGFASFSFASVNPERMSETAKENIPAHAIEKAPGLYYLGEAVDPGSGEMVEGYMIVRPHKESARPAGTGKNKPSGDTSPTASCYSFMASGAKWKTVEPWVVNPANGFGISNASVFSILDKSIAKWEDATDGKIGNGGSDVIGVGSATGSALVADEVSPDNSNEVYFGDLKPGTIGVTIVWGVFGGPVKNRRLVEWDQVYNNYYNWSDAAEGDINAMDFESIATHELGHTMGLADLYNSDCSAMTMYGYGSEGEINARTLEDGDINGMNSLY